MSTGEGPEKEKPVEQGEPKGGKRKASTSEVDVRGKAPSATFIGYYTREGLASYLLSNLREQETEIARKRKELFEVYSQLTSNEDSLMEQVHEIGKKKKAMALRLCGLEKELTDVSCRVGQMEIRVSVNRERNEQFEKSIRTSVEGRCAALEKAEELLKENLTSVEGRCAALEKAEELLKGNLNLVQHNLDQAVEKLTCQICMENTRNSVILPCMHFLYCSTCLHNYQKASKVCPTCRGPISAVLNCNLNID